jgi:type II secretory pathway predicted ATPase ExeA
MYTKKWNLTKKPFENDLDLDFFFEETKHHKQAHIRLLYAAEQRKPLALLIGEGGVGKTYVAQTVRAKLNERKNTLTGWVCASGLESSSFLRAVSLSLGLKAAATREEQAAALVTALGKHAGKKGHTILFVDNVEAADQRFLDEVRFLLDQTGADGRPLLTIVLVGHPRLRGNLKRRQSLVSRLEVGYELLPFEADEARAYVLHRIAEAGGSEEIFDEGALDKVVAESQGYPRNLNAVCDLALLMGMIDKLEQIEAKQIEEASRELGELRAIGSGGGNNDRDEGGRGRGRGRGRDRDRNEEGGGRGRGRGRGGRDRDRDRDRDEEGGRGRGRRRRGRGRKDRDEGSSNDSESSTDDSDYDFNAEEYKDIESMNELIQGSLKVVPGNGRRRRKSGSSKRPERGDPLQYFDGPGEEGEAQADESESSDEGGEKKSRRGRRGRGRRGRKSSDADASEETTAVAETKDDDFGGGLDEASEEREPVKAAAAPAPKAKKDPAPAPAEEDDFGAGL